MKMFHKILGCSTIAAALAISASTTQAQNLLVNPGFETSPAGFTANPVTIPTVGLGWANFTTLPAGPNGSDRSDMSSSPDSPKAGSYSLLEVNSTGNAWNPAGAYQIIANSSVGASWSASIWALTDTGVQGAATAGTGPVDWQIQFLNSSLGNISTIETGWSAIAANDVWQQYNLSGVVPAGTAYISAYAMSMVGPGNIAPVNVYFDSASLTVSAVPEPTTLALAGLGGVSLLSLIRRRKV